MYIKLKWNYFIKIIVAKVFKDKSKSNSLNQNKSNLDNELKDYIKEKNRAKVLKSQLRRGD